MKNLIEGLQSEMTRCRELLTMYEQLPGGVGFFGASTIKQGLAQAEKAIAEGNIIKELAAYENLKTIEG